MKSPARISMKDGPQRQEAVEADPPKGERKEVFSRVIKQAKQLLTPRGYEKPDPRPMAPPIGYKKQPSMMEHMRSMVAAELQRRSVEELGAETEEEANDFEVDDDPFPASPHEADIDAPVDPRAQPADPIAASVARGMLMAEDHVSQRPQEPGRAPAGRPASAGSQSPSQHPPEAGGGGERGSLDPAPEPPPSPRGRSFLRRS